MRLEDLSNEQLGKHVRDRHQRLRAAFLDGKTAHDADETFNHQSRILRALRNTGSSKEIELNGTSEQEEALGEDNPPDFPGRPALPDRNGGGTAVDSVTEEIAIRRSGHSNPEEAIRQARLRRNGSSPASVRAMAESIPGYDRLK